MYVTAYSHLFLMQREMLGIACKRDDSYKAKSLAGCMNIGRILL
jgi:hypothetical protein